MVDISFLFEKKEFLKGYSSNPIIIKSKRKSILISLIMITLFAYSLNGEKIPIIIFATIVGLFNVLFIITKSNNLYEDLYDKTPHLKSTINYSFTNDTLISHGDSFFSEVGWSDITHVSENKNFFYIYINKSTFYLIPKIAFKEYQISEFYSILSINDKMKHDF